MFYMGLAVGFALGTFIATVIGMIAYTRLTNRFDECDLKLRAQKQLFKEVMRECERLSRDNSRLKTNEEGVHLHVQHVSR